MACFIVVRWLGGNSLVGVVAPISEHVSPAIAIFGSIPVGWLCYQLYYFLYRPLILGGWLLRRDRGTEVLEQLTAQQMRQVAAIFPADGLSDLIARPYLEVGKILRVLTPEPQKTRFGRQPNAELAAFAHQWRINWEIVRALIELVASRGGQELKVEFTELSDTYHGVGAARTAVYSGWFAGTGLGLVFGVHHAEHWNRLVVSAALVLAVSLFWGMLVLHRVRRQTWKKAISTVGRGLRLHFAADPDLLAELAAQVKQDGQQAQTTTVEPPPGESLGAAGRLV
jgi:hypothetical protein